MVYGVIYLITCLLNGKKYVGQKVNLKRRIRQHKYGWENFTLRTRDHKRSSKV